MEGDACSGLVSISVLTFGPIRELLGGLERLHCTFAASLMPISARQLSDKLYKEYPALLPLRHSSILAVNLEYVQQTSDTVLLYPHDEVALIPPIR